MALQCKCKFGQTCRFSHEKRLFPVNLEARQRPAGIRPPPEHRQDRDKNREAQQPVSRKRGVDEIYSVRGHGIQAPPRTNPRQPDRSGGRGSNKTGRYDGNNIYASNDVRAPRNKDRDDPEEVGRGAYFTFPFDERLRDAKGRRLGKRQRNKKMTKEDVAKGDARGWDNYTHAAGDSDVTGSEKEESEED